MKTFSNVPKFCALAATAAALIVPAPVLAQKNDTPVKLRALSKDGRVMRSVPDFKDVAACKEYALDNIEQISEHVSCVDTKTSDIEFGFKIPLDGKFRYTWTAKIN